MAQYTLIAEPVECTISRDGGANSIVTIATDAVVTIATYDIRHNNSKSRGRPDRGNDTDVTQVQNVRQRPWRANRVVTRTDNAR